VVSNASPETAQSDGAWLRVLAKLTHYQFNNNLTDSKNGFNGQCLQIDPCDNNTLTASVIAAEFDTGYDGTANGAVELEPNEIIEIIDPCAFPTFGDGSAADSNLHPVPTHGGGLDRGTIIAWIKPIDTGESLRVILPNLTDGFDTPAIRFDIRSNGQVGSFLRGEGTGNMWEFAGSSDRPGTDIYDGDWHLIAMTWDVRSGCSLWIDGTLAASQGENTPSAEFAAWELPILIGASRGGTGRVEATSRYVGLIDELRVYNYQLAEADIVQEYYDYSGLLPCENVNFSPANLVQTGSSWCVIDLADLAEFAKAWLDDDFYVLP
jgi:hypothetical protein